jgi:DNA (cytosine-5)-methyltransferase 1
MNHGSLFSGIGGFDLAAEWMGWDNKFHCDINPFSRKLCSFYWPKAESYEDIKTTDFRIWRGKIDVLSGGFPCQPFSTAGKRMGKEDERHLWPYMLQAIRDIRPKYVVGENVRGLLNWSDGLVLEEVYADLEGEGYEVETFVLPAVSVNAPHRRDRVWIIAHANSDARRSESSEGGRTESQADSDGESSIHLGSEPNGNEGIASNTKRLRLELGQDATDLHSIGSQTQGERNQSAVNITSDDNVHSEQGGPSEIWDGFPIKSPLCSGDDGLPTELDGLALPKWRKESIMGYGNAIVPQIALRIFRTIDENKQKP